MSAIYRTLRIAAIKNTRWVANLQLNKRIYRRAAAVAVPSEAEVEKTLWRQYPPQRSYSNTAEEGVCWHCKAKTKKVNYFICEKCGKLQDITKEFDYFEILSLPRDFDVPASRLTKLFRQLQTLVHPDKFSNKSEREKANSAEWSSLINKAYKTLSQPVIRGQYLLKLQGQEMPSENSTLDKELLMEMMDRNEEVDEANTTEELNEMQNKIQKEINDEIAQLKGLFSSNDLEGAKGKLVKMKYLLSIQSSIKTKLEKLMDS